MLFSFVSTVYNHESYIIAHLESIRFQIENYGSGYDFEMVLCDDGSTDKTLNLARQWLKNNEHLFRSIKILTTEANKGIVKTYVRGLNSFQGDFFHSLGGDDLYGCSNLFRCVELLKEFDVVQGAVLEFEGQQLSRSAALAMYANFQTISLRKLRRDARRCKFIFVAPGFLFKKQLLTQELMTDLLEYKMFEDMPLYHFLLTNNDLKIHFYDTPIVLYRRSPSSISRNVSHSCHSDLRKDNVKFLTRLRDEESSFFRKIYIHNCILWARSAKSRYLFRFNPFSVSDRIRKSFRDIMLRRKTKLYNERLDEMLLKNEIHIKKCSGSSDCSVPDRPK